MAGIQATQKSGLEFGVDQNAETNSSKSPQTLSSGTGTLGKALDVVTAIANSKQPLRFTDLLNQVDQPRGTLHRNISNLLEEGLIAMNPETHIYSLGPRLLQLASQAWSDNDLRGIAQPHMRALNEMARETVHLAVLQGDQVVYLDKFEAHQSLRMHSQIGRSAPVYCTGVGKAILSGLSDDAFEDLAKSLNFKSFTQRTITNVDDLRKDRAASIARGYAIDAEEHEAGIRCAAAPIKDQSGALLGGVSVTAPAYRISDEIYELWTRWVQKTAADIGLDADIKMGPRR
ncbi:MAG: IclR family transcriptional regulator [Hyphomicrobiales bacterium]